MIPSLMGLLFSYIENIAQLSILPAIFVTNYSTAKYCLICLDNVEHLTMKLDWGRVTYMFV
jgi:hypothetical protein